MRQFRVARILPVATLLAAGTTLLAAPSSDALESEQVSQLLSQAKTQAYQLSVDAETMESYTRMNAGWEVHAVAIEQMKVNINAAGRTLAKLEEVRRSASPWQETAIDRIHPLLKEIASNTGIVIGYINKNPKRLFSNEYKDYIETNSDLSRKLAGLIADYVDYGNTKNKLDRLTMRLEAPEK